MLMIKRAEHAEGNMSVMTMASRRPFSHEKLLAICFWGVLLCVGFFKLSQGINCFAAMDLLYGVWFCFIKH